MGPPVVNAYFASQEHKNAYGPRCKTHILLPRNTKILTAPVVKRIFCFPGTQKYLRPPLYNAYFASQEHKNTYGPRCKTHILLPRNTKIPTSPVVKRIFCFPRTQKYLRPPL